MRYLITQGCEPEKIKSVLNNELNYCAPNKEEIYDEEF